MWTISWRTGVEACPACGTSAGLLRSFCDRSVASATSPAPGGGSSCSRHGDRAACVTAIAPRFDPATGPTSPTSGGGVADVPRWGRRRPGVGTNKKRPPAETRLDRGPPLAGGERPSLVPPTCGRLVRTPSTRSYRAVAESSASELRRLRRKPATFPPRTGHPSFRPAPPQRRRVRRLSLRLDQGTANAVVPIAPLVDAHPHSGVWARGPQGGMDEAVAKR